jgi:hypothetical protein
MRAALARLSWKERVRTLMPPLISVGRCMGK